MIQMMLPGLKTRLTTIQKLRYEKRNKTFKNVLLKFLNHQKKQEK